MPGAPEIRRHVWTQAELRMLRALYADVPTQAIAQRFGLPLSRVYAVAHRLGLRKSAEYLASPEAHQLDGVIGKDSRFKKGIVPANKGLRRPGWSAGRMRETQFKPGVRQGVAVKLYKPVGTERISKDGYLERKINDGLPPQKRWRAVHLINWEAINGPLPAGHALVFRTGNKSDARPENMELATRAELMRRNSYHTRYPKEVGLAIQLRGALVRRINKRMQDENQD